MKSYDNSGKVVSEITHFRTTDRKSVTSNTTYSTYNGQPTNQNVPVCENNGKVTTTNVINGKLLP